ncbi:MAG: nuclear transport factor 2 family protein [Thermoleophilaceae bacterium]|nr:nuclear transport factor 2 family protein [Thermoleophilaceae bacterium]
MSAQTDLLDLLTERWERDDRAGVEALVHPDVEIDMTIRVMNPEVYRGYEGLWRYAGDVHSEWEYGRTEIHRYLERGDEVLMIRTTPMRGRLSGVEFSDPVAQRYRFRDGRVAQMTLLTDMERAIADFEAGRPPHPPAE